MIIFIATLLIMSWWAVTVVVKFQCLALYATTCFGSYLLLAGLLMYVGITQSGSPLSMWCGLCMMLSVATYFPYVLYLKEHRLKPAWKRAHEARLTRNL